MIMQQLESKVKNRVYLKQTERANKNAEKNKAEPKWKVEIMRKWTKETPFGKPNSFCLYVSATRVINEGMRNRHQDMYV